VRDSKKTKPEETVKSLSEAVYTLDEAIKKGGKEFLISEKVYSELNSLFPKRETRLGGNGNNMGRALLSTGLDPLVSYPIRPKKLMHASPDFRVALENRFVTPKKAIRNEPEYDHVIFEFKNDRHILSWDPMTSQGIFDYDFLKFACNSKFTDVLVLAYAHLLLPRYKKKTDIIIEELKNRPKVHLEFGTGSEESMRYAMGKFSENGCCDSFGMNEKECRIYFKASSENEKDLMEASVNAMKEYSVKRVCVHNPSFAFSISEYAPQKEIEALKAAHAVSSESRDIKHFIESTGKYNICLIKIEARPNLKRLTGLGDAFAAVQAVKSLF
jgi:ADP-dependent phosphofructokinase/glucokinase